MKTYKKLSDISELVGGYAFKSDNYVSNGIRVVRIANVQDGYFSDEHPCFYSVSITRGLGKAMLQENDLLMSLTGNVGRVAFLPKSMLPAGLNQRVECIRVGDENLKKYLYYYFRSISFVNEAVRNSTGVAQLNLSTKWLGEHLIPVVSPNESASIVKNLEAIDLAIKKCEQEFTYYDELTKSRFIEMFGKDDGDIPLDQLCKICRGASPRPISNYITTNPYGINWIKIGDVEPNAIYIIKTKEKITKEGAAKSRKVYPGDFILSNSMSFGRPYILGIDGCVHDGWLIISNYQKHYRPLFLYFLLRSESVQNQFSKNAGGTTVKNLNSDLVKTTKVNLYPLDKQDEFVNLVEQVDKLKFSNRNPNT